MDGWPLTMLWDHGSCFTAVPGNAPSALRALRWRVPRRAPAAARRDGIGHHRLAFPLLARRRSRALRRLSSTLVLHPAASIGCRRQRISVPSRGASPEPGFRLCFQGPEGGQEVTARCLVIATGAHDRVMPFPGWTLPGVMTPGAAQRLVKLGATPPGRAILLAGSGPFLLAVGQPARRMPG